MTGQKLKISYLISGGRVVSPPLIQGFSQVFNEHLGIIRGNVYPHPFFLTMVTILLFREVMKFKRIASHMSIQSPSEAYSRLLKGMSKWNGRPRSILTLLSNIWYFRGHLAHPMAKPRRAEARIKYNHISVCSERSSCLEVNIRTINNIKITDICTTIG